MEALFYFAVWAIVIFLMMRFGCGAHVLGDGHSGHRRTGESRPTDGLRWVPPDTDKDPVCGQTVRTETAKSSVHGGAVYYFCSRECREVFEAAPDLYVGDRAAAESERLEQANV